MTDKELPLDYVRDGSEGSEIATWLPIDLHVHVLHGDQWWGDHQVCEADSWDEHMVRLLDMALEFWLLRRGIPNRGLWGALEELQIDFQNFPEDHGLPPRTAKRELINSSGTLPAPPCLPCSPDTPHHNPDTGTDDTGASGSVSNPVI